MTAKKNYALTVPVNPKLKEQLVQAAAVEGLTLSKSFEIMLECYAEGDVKLTGVGGELSGVPTCFNVSMEHVNIFRYNKSGRPNQAAFANALIRACLLDGFGGLIKDKKAA